MSANEQATYTALYSGSAEDVAALLAHAPDTSWFFDIALRRACDKGDLSVCELLTKHGLVSGPFPLKYAAESGNTEVCAFLINTSGLGWDDGADALERAAALGHDHICELLLSSGASATADNCSALRKAAKGPHVDAVRALLSRGASATAIRLPARRELLAQLKSHDAALAISLFPDRDTEALAEMALAAGRGELAEAVRAEAERTPGPRGLRARRAALESSPMRSSKQSHLLAAR